MDFTDSIQRGILNEALRLAPYGEIANNVVGVISQSPEISPAVKAGIRAIAYYIGTLEGGNPDGHMILHKVSTIGWEEIGITDIPALTTGERTGFIDVIMGVSKQVIMADAARLTALAGSDTALADGWNDPS